MQKNEREVAAQQFLSQVKELYSKRVMNVTDLNLEAIGDLRLALMGTLRGKTVQEYFDIVGGLVKAYDKAEGNRQEQDRLHTLSSIVMAIGEDVLGIDWS